MKHVHKLAWIGLFVNIIICFVARNLLLDEGQLNFHSRVDSMWSWLVLALFIAVVVQALSIMLSGRYPYMAIVLAFIGGIVMIPISMIFLVGSLFSFQTRINAGFTPWRSTTGAMSRDDNHQLLTFNASAFYPQGALALIAGIIILMIGMGIGGVFIAAGILALCNGYRLQNRVVIGVSDESMIFTPGLYADTYIIPLREVVLAERGSHDAKVRLLIPSTGRSITLRKKMLAGDNVSDTFAAILAKLTTV
ncbi:TPA: hypothetical protein ACP4YQ_001555 [Klebsiella quasipneumoniae]|jgi:hypothetical protein|uniref:hypothetical protein n=1 Tax=Klebsiella quasipneumoniae TaxID=1463165 RepID=UPI001F4E7923|nr:hypothetical protein [Klebsiella quasipneumoniae]MCH9432018.1 hypothetical protein [Klebsiella quasipneumoniae]MCL1508249.1 hypothetical protein [Klebsiella quasipneumoniae]MCT8886889.1 hypothetical protein [Klebsiella quasipneumoniae subsp. similipneumoniae]USP83153.1 hypothetical protein MKM89_14280 [Klebsiella quasipneumoniae]HBR0797789.1 hypothetical protein [Klebsiella quasipneumoniae]